MKNSHKRKKYYRGHHHSPYKAYSFVVVVVSGVVTGYLIYTGVLWWAAYLLAVNAVTFLLFGFDKAIASGSFTRVPERVFYAVAFLGASPALLIGQKVFHHKTLKTSFQIIFWVIVTAQTALIAYVLYRDAFLIDSKSF